MSKFGRVFHWALTIGNGLLAVTSVLAGSYGAAAVSGGLAAVLAWQLTW